MTRNQIEYDPFEEKVFPKMELEEFDIKWYDINEDYLGSEKEMTDLIKEIAETNEN